jgi:hypothetical protein
MARKTVVKLPEAGASLAQRQTALAVVRGLRLAVHSAAGLTKDVDIEAMRLLRVIEGLVITVAGRLQSLGRCASLAAGAPAAAAAAEAAAAAAASTGEPGGGKTNNQLPTDDGKSKKAGKKKKKKKESPKEKDAEMGIAAVPVASAPLSGDAAIFTPSQDGLMDEWADSLPTVFGPTPAPIGFVDSSPIGPPPAAAIAALAALRVPGPRPRPLVARKSGTPPRKCGLGEPEPLPERITASPLLAGSIAAVVGLTSRPDLEGSYVELLEFDSAASRWICRTAKKEQVRLVPEKLQSFQPGLFQQLARSKFETDVKMAFDTSKASNDAGKTVLRS